MTAGQALAFLLFAVVAAITPGPSNLLLTSTGAAVGVPRGLPALFGQAVGMGVMLFLVAFGLGSIIIGNRLIIAILRWWGIAFLLWLARKIATAGHGEATGGGVRMGFWGMAAFQWVNPKSWLVCAAAASTYLEAGAGSAFGQSLALGLLFIAAALPSCFLWLVAGASMQRLLRSARAARAFNLTMAALLAGSILLFIR